MRLCVEHRCLRRGFGEQGRQFNLFRVKDVFVPASLRRQEFGTAQVRCLLRLVCKRNRRLSPK